MNIKDIQIGRYYSLAIWEDDYPFFLKCIEKTDGYWVLECPSMEYPMYIYDHDSELNGLEEITQQRYIIHILGLMIENDIVDQVKTLSEKLKKET